jgi:glycosyltransferase involved in cell wall biosynthesis
MRLLFYAPFPLLAHHKLDGAQQVAHDLIQGLIARGVEIIYLGPEYGPGLEKIGAQPGLHILPPMISNMDRPLFPFEQHQNLQAIAEAVRGVDVVCSLDRAFPLKVEQPIVLILQLFIYTTEMASLWSFNWDTLVVPSPYLHRITEVLAGASFWEGEAPEIKLIPNSVDTTLFVPTYPTGLCMRLGLVASDQYLICPHRPIPSKGFEAALQTIRLLHQRGHQYKLLIPVNPKRESDISFYKALCKRAEQLDIASLVQFHEWVTLEDLPAYFSLAKRCLALGTYPEGYGYTPVQSICCSTPVVSTRSGALGELFPPRHGVEYIGYGAIEEAVAAVLQEVPDEELTRGRYYAAKHYSVDMMVNAYLDCFQNARKVHGRYSSRQRQRCLRLSPWCHLTGDGEIWDDYRMRKFTLRRREGLILTRLQQGDNQGVEENFGLEVARLLARGWLIQ